MNRILCVALAAVVCAVGLFGCGTGGAASPSGSPPPDGPVVGYIGKELSQKWFSAVFAAIEETALERGAARVIAADVEMSSVNYLIALDDMISQGVDCLIVCPPDQYLSQITVEKCAAAGVLVLAESDPLYDDDGRLLLPAIVPDNYACGQMVGRWLGDYLDQSGVALEDAGFLCLTMKSAEGYSLRHEGAVDAFLERVPGFPLKKIFYSNYDGTSQNAFNAAAAAITAHPGVKFWLVFAPNDEGAQSACHVLAQSGKDKNAVAAGIGGYVARDEFEKGSPCFAASVYLDAEETGRLAAEAAMDWLESGQEPWRELARAGESHGMVMYEGVLITPETYQSVMPQA